MPSQFQILFVCSGNICRSPMAEGYLRFSIPPKYKTKVRVSSAGTLGIERSPASLEAIEVMKEKDIDISNHLSQGLSAKKIHDSNLILTMALDHYDYIKNTFKPSGNKLHLLGDFEATNPCEENSIPDPIGSDMGTYKDCRNKIISEIDKAQPKILRMIENYFKK